MKKRNFITQLHLRTKRNYKKRMMTNKVLCMKVAKKYDKDYWDGNRKYGYGGYKYIQNYWKKTAIKIINTYKLKNDSSILDIGCGKGFLLFEIKKLIPEINIIGIDKSKYAITNAKKEIKKSLRIYDATKKLPFKKNSFDLVISLGTLHNFSLSSLSKCIFEINRIAKKSYLMVESYRNDRELFNLQCWALTCQIFLNVDDWLWFLKKNKYKGDYEFIFFE
tara:strand:+ start:3663 stop:4325 length:663 start_codon:yes stop_codon:yes gene_type:complete